MFSEAWLQSLGLSSLLPNPVPDSPSVLQMIHVGSVVPVMDLDCLDVQQSLAEITGIVFFKSSTHYLTVPVCCA